VPIIEMLVKLANSTDLPLAKLLVKPGILQKLVVGLGDGYTANG
jgi:hypothetical protein